MIRSIAVHPEMTVPQPIRSGRFFSIPLAPVLIASSPLTAVAAESDDMPNIVLVLMDNFGWVDFPLYQVLEDHEESIQEDPGSPDP